MANPRAQAAKEKGNAAFKSGDFPNAIGHYTEAILADKTDPTFPLNRTAAYLKLGKNEDAERDSTTVLRLSPSNVKALFRRAQARVALAKLSEARQDLAEALKLEPANSSIQDELTRVDQLIATEKSKKSKHEPTRTPPSTSPGPSPTKSAPKRRRVPIEIIESPKHNQSFHAPSATKPIDAKPTPALKHEFPNLAPASATITDAVDSLTPISTRSLKTPPSPQANAQPQPSSTTTSTAKITAPKPSPFTFSETKAARESSKPSRVTPSTGVGGGIFRANGQSTIFPRGRTPGSPEPVGTSAQSTNANRTRYETAAATAMRTNNGTTVPPMTMFNFNKAWEASQPTEDRWKLITSIPPTSIPTMCKSSLEPSLFISIIDVFLHVVGPQEDQDEEVAEVVKAYLRELQDVPRFNIVLSFLSEKEKGRVRELWTRLGTQTKMLGGVWSVLVR